MINDSLESLCQFYMDVIRDFYPGRADEWNIVSSTLGIYDKKSVSSFLEQIKEIREKAIKCSKNKVDEYGKYNNLLRNIDLRIFELEEYRMHERTCSFYTDTIFMTLCDVIDMEEKMKSRLKYFPKACETAISNFDTPFISKLDCINSLRLSEELFERIRQAYPKYITPEISDCFERYKSKLISFRDCSKTVYLPYSPQSFEQKLKLYTGISRIDIDSLYHSVCSYIFQDKIYESTISKEPVSREMIKEQLNYIMQQWQNILNWKESFVDSYQITDKITENMYYNKSPGAAYRAEKINETGRTAEIIIDPDQYNSIDELELSLVHEIIGHHWLSYCSDNSTCSKLNINEVFDEGWARYCEYYYSSRLVDNMNVKETFEKKLRKSFISVFIGIEAYYYQKSIKQIISELEFRAAMKTEKAKSAVIATLINPFFRMQYGLGLMIFKAILDNRDLKECSVAVASSNYSFDQLQKQLGE